MVFNLIIILKNWPKVNKYMKENSKTLICSFVLFRASGRTDTVLPYGRTKGFIYSTSEYARALQREKNVLHIYTAASTVMVISHPKHMRPPPSRARLHQGGDRQPHRIDNVRDRRRHDNELVFRIGTPHAIRSHLHDNLLIAIVVTSLIK
jgi:hypothetical protein